MRLRNRFNRIQTIIIRAITQFDRKRGFEAVASLAFYSVVSLFPMLLLTIAGARLWFEGQEAKQRLLQILFEFTPTLSQDLICRNIDQVLEQRKGSGLVALRWRDFHFLL